MTPHFQEYVTVSEMQSFMRCRVAWDYGSPFRQALTRVGPPAVALHFGSLVHQALAANAVAPGDKAAPFTALQAYSEKSRLEARTQYMEVVGAEMPEQTEQLITDLHTKAHAIVVNYFDKWGYVEPLGRGLRYLPKSIEQTFICPIPDTPGKVTGTFDGLAIDNSSRGWIVDHKTFSMKPQGKSFDFSFQFLTYMWAAALMFGPDQIAGAVYDGISSKLPKEPDLLQSGAMSRKHIATTPHVYARTLQRHGMKPADYADILQTLVLDNQGLETDWHHRVYINFNIRAIERHGPLLTAIWKDMQSPALYPNLRWEGCWDCRFQDLCHARINGEDEAWLIKASFRKDGQYGTTKALANPQRVDTPVTCLQDLA